MRWGGGRGIPYSMAMEGKIINFVVFEYTTVLNIWQFLTFAILMLTYADYLASITDYLASATAYMALFNDFKS